MSYKHLIYFSILISFATYSRAADTKYLTADDIPKCDGTNSVALNECIKKLVDYMIPHFRNGDKDLGIMPLDPLILNSTTLRYTSSTSNNNGRILVKGATVTGVANLYHKKMDFAIDKNGKGKGRSITVIPILNVVGGFKARITFNGIKLQPQGDFNLTLKEVVSDTQFDGEIYAKDGHRFFRIENYNSDPTAKDFHIDATGIFDDRELNDALLTLINSSWREIFKTILPETRKYWAPVVKSIVNEALSRAPLDDFADNL